jgi:tRNA pseudouridine38-40 synthase
VLEAGLSQLFAQPVKVTAAGRTDSGVHASGQVVSVATTASFPFERLTPALTALLPPDCSVRDVAIVEPDFSARFSAVERTYVYAVLNRRARSALLARYSFHVPFGLNPSAMGAAAAYLVGEHDFRSFASPAANERTVRCIHRLEIEPRGELMRIEVAADGFLHHMVRTVVGTLIECGAGRRDPAEMARILGARDRMASGSTAPAQGLYLAGVRYGNYDSFSEPPILRPGRAAPWLDGPAAFP